MVPAVWVANEPLELVRLTEGLVTVGNPAFRQLWQDGLAGGFVPRLLWELAGRPPGTPAEGIRDDNRSALLPAHRTVVGSQEYVVSVKGCGAKYDAFQPRRLSHGILREICHDPELRRSLEGREGEIPNFLLGERWWGYAPYGGQAADNALVSLLASLRADVDQIAGFHICPVVAAVQLPPAIAAVASQFYWMRRYDGAYWQEVRLMPSNVRLYFHSPLTLGVDPARVLALYQLDSLERCADFLEHLLASAIAATTLLARTLRYDSDRSLYTGLDFFEVYLDKDSVVAGDGTLHFADLEGVEPFQAENPHAVKERIFGQFYQNIYEASYAVEMVARTVWSTLGITASESDRRAWTLERLEHAVQSDPYVRVHRSGERLTLTVEPAVDPEKTSLELIWTSGTEGAAVGH
ncbi:MAG: hypothetical protein L3K18_03220 [Thermoplasmata archaeon]|nr:hypothetical protein [Thermoplasmata archaeon]MCI4356142.1 hypothetical protein [Thermoplasmata archaeon]